MPRSSTDLPTLFRRRLLVVAGKGGVGKTTVACALALEAGRLGLRTLLCEVDGVSRAPQLFGVSAAPVGEVVEARPGVFLMAVEGKAALAEYLQMVVPVRRLIHAVFSSRIYQYFVAAAPGLKELMTMGKIWYEAEREDEDAGRKLWDVVIMDAPATGHSLQYLRMPAAARDAFGTGLVKREAQRVVDLLTDPGRTAVNLVTTPEEIPVNETVSMYRQLHDELGMPTGLLFVNRVHRADFADATIERLMTEAEQSEDGRVREALREVAARARQEAGWTRLNARHRARLARQIDMPTVEIPDLRAEEFGFAELKQVVGCIGPKLGDRRRTRRHK